LHSFFRGVGKSQRKKFKHKLFVLNLKFLSDRGGLFYPSKEFVSRLHTIYSFVIEVLPAVVKSKHLLEDFVDFLTSIVMRCSTFSCHLGSKEGSLHNEQLVIDMLSKFISPLLKNYAKSITDAIARKAAEDRKLKKATAFRAAKEKKKQTATNAQTTQDLPATTSPLSPLPFVVTNSLKTYQRKSESRKLKTLQPF